jgi:isopenicillin N synthase-like dioxygenase
MRLVCFGKHAMGIPVIDLHRFLAGDPDERVSLARETDRICREIGFLSVIGHGVPASVVRNLYDVSKAFFHQSTATKTLLQQPASDVVRGYIGFGRGALAKTRGEESPPDLKESYNIGPDAEDAGSRDPSNIWPPAYPDFRAAWLAYYAEMDRLSSQVMRLFAYALELDDRHFETAFYRHPSVLSAIYYPEPPVPPREGQLRAGAHTDFGAMTILRPDNAPGGLQVMTRSGEWLPVSPADNSFIINIGDLMARWTNDRWVSTLHRVVNPPSDIKSGAERLSIGFFYQPNNSFVVECLPSCRNAEGRALYVPVTVGDFMRDRFASQIVPKARPT